MRVAPYGGMTCSVNGCKGTKMEYEGNDRLRCPKCRYSTTYFAEDNLVFTFTFEKGQGWLLHKVYYDTDWVTPFEKELVGIKAAVHWSIYGGCSLWRLYLNKSFQFQSGDRKPLDITLLDHVGGRRYDIYDHVTTYVKEWAAGMQTPEGYNR